MFKIDPYDKRHNQNLVALAKKIEEIYRNGQIRISMIGANGKLDERDWFLFENDKAMQKRADAVLKQMHDDIINATNLAQDKSVSISVEKSTAMALYANWLDEAKKTGISQRAFDALEAFQHRKVDGMNLSDRVWNLTDQFKQEMELGLQCGIADGVPATEMAREMRSYLNEPNKLFRRVRDEFGVLRLSKAMMAYHPGPGIYRSSYKNALRMTRTETNIAYRSADYDNWKEFDFVTGIKVQTSQSNHEVGDICDELAGVYPKTFKFTGWHPQCRCHAIPLMKTREEMAKDDERILDGKEPLPSKNEVKELPKNFKDWVADNKERIEKADAMGKTPYFINDNRAMLNIKSRNSLNNGNLSNEGRNGKNKAKNAFVKNKSNDVVFSAEQIKNNIELENALGIKKGDPMAMDKATSSIINDIKSNNNCQCCVVAYEMRRRGFDVKALDLEVRNPSHPSMRLSSDSSIIWEKADGGKPQVNTVKELSGKALEKEIKNGRYTVEWDYDENVGHIIVAERVGKEVLFYDPQRNDFININFEKIMNKSLKVCRIDRLLIDTSIIASIVKKVR